MDHYVDIDLRPDPEIARHQLMSALFGRLHRALAADPDRRIAVSFPHHDAGVPCLGDRLRLHGTEEALGALSARDWLKGMNDHVAVSAPQAVPSGAVHRCVRRVQTQSSPDRLRRRLMRRHGLDEAEAHRRIPDTAARSLRLPFVQLCSASTGQPFRLFIEHGPILTMAQSGVIGAYGLSQTATVPWF